jgi:hypothetical protein
MNEKFSNEIEIKQQQQKHRNVENEKLISQIKNTIENITHKL